MNRLRTAFRFLTRFPVGSNAKGGSAEELSASVLFYFLPALVVGLVGAAVNWAVCLLRVPYLGALAYVIAETLATGALHVDGFADVCDAFLCVASPERRLEILKDSRLGTFGVAGVAFDIGCKVLLVGALSPGLATWSLLSVIPVLGKISLVLCAACSDAVRPDGLGHAFLSGLRPADCVASLLFCGVLAAALIGWLLGAVCCLAALVAGLAMRAVAYREIGGVTGDVLGACNELGEVICLIVCVSTRIAK